MPTAGISISPECVEAFDELKMGKKGLVYIIYKISENGKDIVVDETSTDTSYEDFRKKLISKADPKASGKTRPSYAVYDVRFNTEDGARTKITFISYADDDKSSIKARMVHASSLESLKNALNGIALVYKANDEGSLEWETLLAEAAKGQKLVK